MNREWVVFHLTEAQEELTRTIAEVSESTEYGYAEYWAAMQHLYHHLNTAWNAREATPEQVARATDADFNRWGSLPSDLPMMRV